MTSLARRALINLHKPGQRCTLAKIRALHSTSIVRRKKQALDVEDLFDDLEIVDETAPQQQDSNKAQFGPRGLTIAASDASTSKPRGRVKRKLSPEERQQKFDQMLSFMKPRLGRKPQVQLPQVRGSAWDRLLQYATSEEQLKQVVELLPKWKDSGRTFKFDFPESFIRRCQELHCQPLALQVFSDFARYNLDLTLPAARQLLHSFYRLYPIENIMTASALYGLYSLPAVSQDLVSAAIMVDACLTHNSQYSNRIAEELIPQLALLLKETKVDTDDKYHRSNVWVQKAVENINKTLRERNKEVVGNVSPLRRLVVEDVIMDNASQPQVS